VEHKAQSNQADKIERDENQAPGNRALIKCEKRVVFNAA
jgi:hypothetical protein